MRPSDTWIIPDWPAPPRVRVVSTTRLGGYSEAPFDSLNFGDHVGDDPQNVARNRAFLRENLALSREPLWLRQVHGIDVARGRSCEADAAISATPGEVCVIMTADCLPVILCDRSGRIVAAAHAGWRGMLNGVIETTVSAMGVRGEDLLAWLGPAIGPEHFEVGADVYQSFCARHPESTPAFVAGRKGHWYADIFTLGRQALARAGVNSIYGGGLCTFADPHRFFSFRRDGKTGRMATLIWLEND